MSLLRQLPSVDQLISSPAGVALAGEYGHALTVEAVRQALSSVRAVIHASQGLKIEIPSVDDLIESAAVLLANWTAPTLKPVINASGVVIHTNLGRAPLSQSAIQAMLHAAVGYSTLEYDLEKGERGSRSIHAEALIRRLTGAETALVVNNNAAAVLLCLSALAKGKRVIISRTQLIEIGGSFRIPDVMRQSGAKLVEVGATNRVHLSDYSQALADSSAALVLIAHWSNFRIIGFTSEPALADLVALAHAHALPLVHDLGSGTFLDTSAYGLAHELTVQEVLNAGVDLVTFSGDKLLGGPQAGIIAGRAALLDKIKKHPLARAVRADKLCLSALSATLLHYLKGDASLQIPIWRMIAATPGEIKERAIAWQASLEDDLPLLRKGSSRLEIIPSSSTVGGGSLPGETLPTYVLALRVRSPKSFVAQLRQLDPPVVTRLQDDQVLFDPRTVLPEQDQFLVHHLYTLLST